MAPSAVAEPIEPSALDGTERPPSNVVVPPKEIRAILEKTAGYVARNGTAFEDRIRQKEVANPKFSFLNPNDAYSAFYLWRLSEIRAGRGTTVSAGPIGESATPAAPQKPKGPQQPPDFHFSARMPNINAQDLDVVRLTALWVAKNGRSFMTSLSQRESNNFQFDFLRPQHSLYQFFSRLVDQYSELLNARGTDGGKAEEARIAELSRNIKDRFHILDRAKHRAEWVRHQEREKQKQEEEAESEKVAYAQIDWHDFVIVESVLFNEADDEADLPPPTSLSDLQSASLEQKAFMSLAPHNMRIEEAMPTDDPYYNGYQQQQQVPSGSISQSAAPMFAPPPSLPARPIGVPAPPPSFFPQPPPLTMQSAPPPARPSSTNPANAPMKIRSDYVPRAAAARAATSATHAICPNCKQPVLYGELQEHMRIELLDPQWKEQRAKAESRYATTNLSTAEVASNLKRLASQRTDVFDEGVVRAAAGGTGGGGANGAPMEVDPGRERKRMAMGMGYDGSMQGQPVNIEEQLRRIQEKAASGKA